MLTALTCLVPLVLPAEGTLPLKAVCSPVASSTYELHREHDEVARTLSALPAVPDASVSVDALRRWLPVGAREVGEVWEFPVARALPILANLHPGVTAELRHARGPFSPAVEGGRATLVRSTATELELLVRVHVEFELVADKMWLLPAQFEGHLVWDCKRNLPREFHLGLPSRDTNYDLNYKNSIDIGHLPELAIGIPGQGPAQGEAIEAARKRLRAAFYPSARINWHESLPDALAAAERSGKRLHVMQLFGTLDDESC